MCIYPKWKEWMNFTHRTHNSKRFCTLQNFLLLFFRSVIGGWIGAFVKQAYVIWMVRLKLKYLKIRLYLHVYLPWRNVPKYENISKYLAEFDIFFFIYSHLQSIYSNELLVKTKTEKKKIERRGRNDLHWRVFSAGESIGIQLSHLIIPCVIQPLFMSFFLFLKSSGLCLPMLWHMMRQGCACDNASVHTAGMFSIWTHQLPKGRRALSFKIKHELGFQHCVGFGRHHMLLHYLGRNTVPKMCAVHVQ